MQILEMRAAQYAVHRNVSREAIRKAIENGRIPKDAIRDQAGVKLINVAAADMALGQAQIRTEIPADAPPFAGEKNPPSSAPGDGGGDAGAPSLTSARTQSELYNAELRRLEFEQKIGRVLDVADVERAMQRWAEVAVREIDQLASRADDLAGAFTRAGVDGVRAALKEITRNMRATIEKNMRLLGADDVDDVEETESDLT